MRSERVAVRARKPAVLKRTDPCEADLLRRDFSFGARVMTAIRDATRRIGDRAGALKRIAVMMHGGRAGLSRRGSTATDGASVGAKALTLVDREAWDQRKR